MSAPDPRSLEPLRSTLLTRRAAIARVTALLGGVALVGVDELLAGRLPERGAEAGRMRFSHADVAFLDEVAETILPQTSTPGAKAAATGAFMARWVEDVYSLRNQEVFREGMERLDAACVELHGVGFLDATPGQRLALLERLDREQHAHTAERGGGSPHYFRLMKELALLGYFTSEIGYHQAQRYMETPGRFDPCAPYSPGERAWAPHA